MKVKAETLARGRWFEYQGNMINTAGICMPIHIDGNCDIHERGEVAFDCIEEEDAERIQEYMACKAVDL